MRVPALGGVVELDVQVRDAPDPQARAQLVADERHRVAERSQGASRSAGWPMTLTQTFAWRRSAVVSTPVIVANPTRGSATSRVTIAADLLPQELVDSLGPLAHDNRMAATNASWPRPG